MKIYITSPLGPGPHTRAANTLIYLLHHLFGSGFPQRMEGTECNFSTALIISLCMCLVAKYM